MNSAQEDRWSIIFEGKLLPGFDKETVINGIEQDLRIPREKLEYIFSGSRIVLKEDIPLSELNQVKQKYIARGLDIELELQSSTFVILGDPNSAGIEKDDDLLDRSKYSSQKVVSWNQARVERLHTVDKAPAYFDYDVSKRIGRITFINSTLCILIISIVVMGLIIIYPALYELQKLLPFALFFPFCLFMFFFLFRLAALRFHDFEFNEWFAILYVLPVIGLLISFFSKYHLFKHSIFIEMGKLVDYYAFYPSLVLFSVVFLLLALVPGSKKKNTYGNKVQSGGIISTVILLGALVLLGLFWADDLLLT